MHQGKSLMDVLFCPHCAAIGVDRQQICLCGCVCVFLPDCRYWCPRPLSGIPKPCQRSPLWLLAGNLCYCPTGRNREEAHFTKHILDWLPENIAHRLLFMSNDDTRPLERHPSVIMFAFKEKHLNLQKAFVPSSIAMIYFYVFHKKSKLLVPKITLHKISSVHLHPWSPSVRRSVPAVKDIPCSWMLMQLETDQPCEEWFSIFLHQS